MSAQNPPHIDTSAYKKRMERLQNDEQQSPNLRQLAGKILRNLRESNYNAAVNLLENLAAVDRKSDLSLEARMILIDLALRVWQNPEAAQRQFRVLTEEQKGRATDQWLEHSPAFIEKKNPQLSKAAATFLTSVGDWAERARYPKTDKIRFQVASLLPETAKERETVSIYERVAQTSVNTEDQNKALLEKARILLESDRFSEALATLRRITSPDGLKARFDQVIPVCMKNPDSVAAVRDLQQEKKYCPAGPLRRRFDLAIAQIYIREEMYEEAEAHLRAADTQYSYQEVMDELKKRIESEDQKREELQKKIIERMKTLAQEDRKP